MRGITHRGELSRCLLEIFIQLPTKCYTLNKTVGILRYKNTCLASKRQLLCRESDNLWQHNEMTSLRDGSVVLAEPNRYYMAS